MVLRDLENENLTAINEMLWGLVHTHHRYFNELASLADDSDNVNVIANLLRNIGRDGAKRSLTVSVRNESVDIALRRHMLAAVAHHAVIHADLDLLTDISVQAAIGVVQALEKGFEKTMARKENAQLTLAVKRREKCIYIAVKHASECVFAESVVL